MSKQKVVWECQSCGHTQTKWTGNCESCKGWNTFLEKISLEVKQRYQAKPISSISKPLLLKDISYSVSPRISTKIEEVDHLFGGGIVVGSLNLIGGKPGIGKSTLSLQMAGAFSKNGKKVLYVSGEESLEQISLRAKRLNIFSDTLYFLSETSFESINNHVNNLKPDVIFVDSVQVLYCESIPSSAGSVLQVRQIATECMHLAKGSGITIFLIGHVTKTGDIAGPMVLEHLVDAVLEFEGDSQHGFRVLRSLKNRFGSTDEVALFQMEERGLVEVPNPSEFFLKERAKKDFGSTIVATVDGTRAILVEVQALVTKSVFSNPTRKSSGFDQNRLSLLLAVLEKKVGFALYGCDVFVSLAGGMKIAEPALDLSVVLAIASSFTTKAIPSEMMVIGEVGLGGEVRSVIRIESRIKEAASMGFSSCILPKRNLEMLSKKSFDGMRLIGVERVDQAMQQIGLS